MNGENTTEIVNTESYAELKKTYGSKTLTHLYGMAIMKYGRLSRINLAIEEMSELTKELCKYMRDKSDFDAMCEEMADVEIMLEQLKVVFNNGSHVNIYKEKKRQRLLERMNHGLD